MRASNPLKQQIQQSLAADNLLLEETAGCAGQIERREKAEMSHFHPISSGMSCGEGAPADPCPDSLRVPPQAELSAPSSPFLHLGFEEPETTAVEETRPEPPFPGDTVLEGSAGSGGHREWAQESSGEQQPLPELYQRLVVEGTEPSEPVAEYISNAGSSALPPDTAPEPPEPPEPDLSIFPSAFLAPALCCQGNLTLDTVKLSCSSFPR